MSLVFLVAEVLDLAVKCQVFAQTFQLGLQTVRQKSRRRESAPRSIPYMILSFINTTAF